jgi:prepilin-type N-terminal cleavage/methylation domain-containing protein/prepilin-type processing-associated H-X9-DG protein
MRHARNRARRGGFTLVELLVVIAIIGILIALLLPAVQAAREAARSLECRNHLRQLAVAALNHEQAHGHYPTGGWGFYWIGDPDRGFAEDQPGGWIFCLLPFLEQQDLYQLPADGDANTVTSQQRAGSTLLTRMPLATLNCPSRRASIVYPKPWDGTFIAYNADNNPASDNVASRTDYAANAGCHTVYAYQAGPSTLSDAATYPWFDTSDFRGVSYQRSVVRQSDIRDGTTNTFLFGEKYVMPDAYSTGMIGSDNESPYAGFNNDHHRLTSVPPLRDRPGYDHGDCFGSPHSAGCHFAFCDGSVHPIGYEIDLTVFLWLGDRRDGQTIDKSEF